MKPGTEITCPHCGQDSFASKKTLMDGWTKIGEILVCASCGAKLADIDEKSVDSSRGNVASGLYKLAGALGVEEAEKRELRMDDDEKRFCRDCAHFISHPFLSRCSLLDKEVNPMDDCGEFKPKGDG